MSDPPAPPSSNELPRMLVGTIVPSIIGSVFVLARFYTRAFITENFGTDDCFMFIAWTAAIVLSILNCLIAEDGSKQLAINPDIPFEDNFFPIVKLSYSLQLIYQFVLWATKMGVCFFYFRVFDWTSARWTISIVIGVFTAAFILIEFLAAFRCRPISWVWDIYKMDGPTCYSNHKIILSSTIINITGDIFLMVFVTPHFLRLKIRRRQKILLILIVSLGFLVIAAAIYRLLHTLRDQANTSAAADIIIWSAVEVYTGIFCASAPCIRPLLRKIAPGFLSEDSDTGPSSAQNVAPYYMKSPRSHRQQPDEFDILSSIEGFHMQRMNTSSTSCANGNSCSGDGDDCSEKEARSGSGSTHIVKTVEVFVNHSV